LGVARAGSILGGVWFILALVLLLVVWNTHRG
jgi:hypothetical protein